MLLQPVKLESTPALCLMCVAALTFLWQCTEGIARWPFEWYGTLVCLALLVGALAAVKMTALTILICPSAISLWEWRGMGHRRRYEPSEVKCFMFKCRADGSLQRVTIVMRSGARIGLYLYQSKFAEAVSVLRARYSDVPWIQEPRTLL